MIFESSQSINNLNSFIHEFFMFARLEPITLSLVIPSPFLISEMDGSSNDDSAPRYIILGLFYSTVKSIRRVERPVPVLVPAT